MQFTKRRAYAFFLGAGFLMLSLFVALLALPSTSVSAQPPIPDRTPIAPGNDTGGGANLPNGGANLPGNGEGLQPPSVPVSPPVQPDVAEGEQPERPNPGQFQPPVTPQNPGQFQPPVTPQNPGTGQAGTGTLPQSPVNPGGGEEFTPPQLPEGVVPPGIYVPDRQLTPEQLAQVQATLDELNVMLEGDQAETVQHFIATLQGLEVDLENATMQEIIIALEEAEITLDPERAAAILDYLQTNYDDFEGETVVLIQNALADFAPNLTEEQIAALQAALQDFTLTDEQIALLNTYLEDVELIYTGENLEILLSGGSISLTEAQVDFIIAFVGAGDNDLTQTELLMLKRALLEVSYSLTPEQIAAIEQIINAMPQP